MSRTRPLKVPNRLNPGSYIFWQQRTYQVTALDPSNALLLHVQSLAEGAEMTLSVTDLLARSRSGPPAPLFAPTLSALHQQVEACYGATSGTVTHDLPESYVIKARIVTTVVAMVRRLVSEDERRAKARDEAISHQQAIRRALIAVNKTTIQIQVRETSQEIERCAGLTTYYKYERLYATDGVGRRPP